MLEHERSLHLLVVAHAGWWRCVQLGCAPLRNHCAPKDHFAPRHYHQSPFSHHSHLDGQINPPSHRSTTPDTIKPFGLPSIIIAHGRQQAAPRGRDSRRRQQPSRR